MTGRQTFAARSRSGSTHTRASPTAAYLDERELWEEIAQIVELALRDRYREGWSVRIEPGTTSEAALRRAHPEPGHIFGMPDGSGEAWLQCTEGVAQALADFVLGGKARNHSEPAPDLDGAVVRTLLPALLAPVAERLGIALGTDRIARPAARWPARAPRTDERLFLAIKLEDHEGGSHSLSLLLGSTHAAAFERLALEKQNRKERLDRQVACTAWLAKWSARALDLRDIVPGRALPLPSNCLGRVTLAVGGPARTVLASARLGESDGRRALEIAELIGPLVPATGPDGHGPRSAGRLPPLQNAPA
jgi:hypothetical protein